MNNRTPTWGRAIGLRLDPRSDQMLERRKI
jgi:hypothetical protein